MYHTFSHHVSCKFSTLYNIWKILMLMSNCFNCVCATHYSCRQIAHRHCSVFRTEVLIICQKEWCDMIYSGLKTLLIVTLSMFCFVNIIWDIFMNVKQSCWKVFSCPFIVKCFFTIRTNYAVCAEVNIFFMWEWVASWFWDVQYINVI